MIVTPPNDWGSSADDTRPPLEVARCRPISITSILVLVEDESPDAHIPQRIARPRMREVAEGHRGHRRVPAQRRFEWLRDRWLFAVDPELLVKALHQLPGRRQPPRELREDLVLFVDPREFRIGARLAVVIALILVFRKEPQPIADNRAAKDQREIAVSGSRIPALLDGVRNSSWTGWLVRPAACRSTTSRTRTARSPAS